METKTINIDFKNNYIVKVKSWKTFKGMVYQLKCINKRFKKMNVIGDFIVRLPLK